MGNKAALITLLAGILSILVPGGIAEAFSGAGSGTQEDPYIITNVDQLQEMNDDLDAWYELGNDIDASDTINWNDEKGFVPIGMSGNRFTGHFDGKGHTVTGLYINRPSRNYVGLFGFTEVGSEVKNINLMSATITGKIRVGSLIGNSLGTLSNSYSAGTVNGEDKVGILAGYNYYGSITNCYSTGDVSGRDKVGGLAGYNNHGIITNSNCSGTVSGNSATGGLVGHFYYGTITNCHSTATVNGIGGYVGGLVGLTYGGTINASFATGDVTGNSRVGGLVGLTESTGSAISTCYSSGSVNGSDFVGGLVGLNYEGTINNSYATGSVDGVIEVGGLIGLNQGAISTITNSYSTGRVTGNDYVGGLVGWNDGNCTDCFWNTQTSGQETSAGGTGKTTTEMRQEATFTNWDFDTIWDIIENTTYPFLREVLPPIPTLKWPLAGDIGDRQVLLGFGDVWTWTYCGGLPKKHTGVDLKASVGENVYAPEGGIVYVGQDSQTSEWAYYVLIYHSGYTTVCWHINPIVADGESVVKGQVIGTIASIPDDDHLHFGVRAHSYEAGLSQVGALPQNDCGGYPGFPEYFVDPMTLEYETTQALVPPEVTPRPEPENPQPASLAADVSLIVYPVAPPSWYGEETWKGAAIRLLDNILNLIFRIPFIILVPIEIEGVQAHEWKGDNATAVTVAVTGASQTQTDAIKIREASDAFIWKEVIIPENAYGLIFDGIFLGEADGDKLIVSFDDKTLFIDDGTLFSDTLWAKPGIIYIGDLAGETGILQFWLKGEGDPNLSILIDNIAFTNYSQVGDFDGDMDVDLADLHTLVLHWLAEDCNYPDWCEGTDLDYKGSVDFIDYATFAENWLWEKIPADFDIDGDVDFDDYAVFASHWTDQNCTEPNWCDGTDLNKSGSVDLYDLAQFAKRWLEDNR